VIVVHAEIYAQVPQLEAVREAMLTAQTAAREQDGCISFAFAESLEEPGRFLAVERWRDAAALEAHFASDSYREYVAAVGPRLVRDSEVSAFDGVETRLADLRILDLRQDD
jgi:quinol monooxygenase YgiN